MLIVVVIIIIIVSSIMCIRSIRCDVLVEPHRKLTMLCAPDSARFWVVIAMIPIIVILTMINNISDITTTTTTNNNNDNDNDHNTNNHINNNIKGGHISRAFWQGAADAADP